MTSRIPLLRIRLAGMAALVDATATRMPASAPVTIEPVRRAPVDGVAEPVGTH